MTAATRDLPPVAESRRIDVAAQCLVGGICASCDAQTWPRRSVCPQCSAIGPKPHLLPRTGTLLSWTRVFVPLAGVQAPFILVQVRLDDSVTLFGHLRGTPESGVRRVLTHVDDGAHPPFWFTLAEGAE